MVIIYMLSFGYWLHGVAKEGVQDLISAIFLSLEECTAIVKRT